MFIFLTTIERIHLYVAVTKSLPKENNVKLLIIFNPSIRVKPQEIIFLVINTGNRRKTGKTWETQLRQFGSDATH